VENSNNVFMFCPILSFYVNFHSKFLLTHLPRTLVLSMSKLVRTTILEKTFSNKIDNIMLFVGMPFPIEILVMGLVVYSTHVIPCSLGVICFCIGFHIKYYGL